MKIDFEEASHTYWIDGKQVPSVTQCLSLLDPFKNIDRHILEAARQFGQAGHKAMALLIRDKLDWGSLDRSLVPYIEAGAKFLGDFSNHVIVASEQILGSAVLGVAGCCDIIMEDEHHTVVVEFKFTSALPEHSVGPQTAAYARLLQGMRPSLAGRLIKRRCVVLGPGDYKTYLLTDPSDWNDFLSCLNVTKRRMKYGLE